MAAQGRGGRRNETNFRFSCSLISDSSSYFFFSIDTHLLDLYSLGYLQRFTVKKIIRSMLVKLRLR